ncbi:hypothetical protein [Planctobacterium marinum]|uniref:hypothetical protein n=1 Tax=Planctobacterium marinum TaxID=1631968 RepID=UPI0030C75DB4
MQKHLNSLAKPLFLALISCFSPVALASSNKIQWELYLIAISVISIAGAWWITSKKSYESPSIKFLVASVYFWIFTFFQTIVWALIYELTG